MIATRRSLGAPASGFDAVVARDAEHFEVPGLVRATLGARNAVVGGFNRVVFPHRLQHPALAVTARATRRQSAV